MLKLFPIRQCKIYMLISTIFAAGLSFAAIADGAESHFALRGPFASGAANVAPAVGGEYVYGRPVPDARPTTSAMLIGTPPRTDYTLLSPDEEEALVKMQDAQRLAEVRQSIMASRAQYRVKRPNLKWPKVVLRGQEVCVPELASSEADDWKDHLTCYRLKEASDGNP